MLDPADLPNELFSMVLDLALRDESDNQRLCGLSILNRCCSMVRTLNIGNWGYFDYAYTPSRDNKLPLEELEMVIRVIHGKGIGYLESSILEGLAKRDRRPVMALLLISLPNLSTLFAHVPRSDPVLWMVLEHFDLWFDLDEPLVLKDEIWKGLLAHKTNLETIDIDLYGLGTISACSGRFIPLRDFSSLKHVSLQLQTLLDDDDEDLPPPYLPKDTLPPTLESLTTYRYNDYGFPPELPTQLQDLVSPDFPCLRTIVMEDMGGLYDLETEDFRASLQALEQKCNENGVEFRIQHGDQLRHDGIRQDLWAKTLYMREDGHQRADQFVLAPKGSEIMKSSFSTQQRKYTMTTTMTIVTTNMAPMAEKVDQEK
ncbi:uncharacterized protein KD926_008277 [Aspergillus affinis]|uniref:uncharacterized protein n=1 Tax=Aspergillus affinis TaxID=1070780 RepID=UPI0022FDE9F6|nr:uncharacterized protein KD926_008277 [Aspergillus affinis]KAI9040454.1 hypothetical protein KD926_008277 [Aspergillus affinis]